MKNNPKDLTDRNAKASKSRDDELLTRIKKLEKLSNERWKATVKALKRHGVDVKLES